MPWALILLEFAKFLQECLERRREENVIEDITQKSRAGLFAFRRHLIREEGLSRADAREACEKLRDEDIDDEDAEEIVMAARSRSEAEGRTVFSNDNAPKVAHVLVIALSLAFTSSVTASPFVDIAESVSELPIAPSVARELERIKPTLEPVSLETEKQTFELVSLKREFVTFGDRDDWDVPVLPSRAARVCGPDGCYLVPKKTVTRYSAPRMISAKTMIESPKMTEEQETPSFVSLNAGEQLVSLHNIRNYANCKFRLLPEMWRTTHARLAPQCQVMEHSESARCEALGGEVCLGVVL